MTTAKKYLAVIMTIRIDTGSCDSQGVQLGRHDEEEREGGIWGEWGGKKERSAKRIGKPPLGIKPRV